MYYFLLTFTAYQTITAYRGRWECSCKMIIQINNINGLCVMWGSGLAYKEEYWYAIYHYKISQSTNLQTTKTAEAEQVDLDLIWQQVLQVQLSKQVNKSSWRYRYDILHFRSYYFIVLLCKSPFTLRVVYFEFNYTQGYICQGQGFYSGSWYGWPVLRFKVR